MRMHACMGMSAHERGELTCSSVLSSRTISMAPVLAAKYAYEVARALHISSTAGACLLRVRMRRKKVTRIATLVERGSRRARRP